MAISFSRTAQHPRKRLPAFEARLELVPMRDPVLAQLPAPQDLALAQAAVEIDEPLVEALELAADLLELAQIAVDLPGRRVDLGLQAELLPRRAPLRTSLR